MKKTWVAGLLSTFVTFSAMAADSPVATKGQMMLDADDRRLAPVQRVEDDGAAAIILDGKVITVPANTLSAQDGKLKTNLTKNQVLSLP